MSTKLSRSYSVLSALNTFEDRFEYLRLGGGVGYETFGHNRYLNQQFYASKEWQEARRFVVLRDNGCDLGIHDYPIRENVIVHHINPMTVDDIINGELWIIDPEYLITTTHDTHNAIHYGGEMLIPRGYQERRPNDTKLW